MSLRFRRTLRMSPFFRINLSGSGASLSMGPRGASITLGRQGIYQNLGLPGTGLSYRKKLSGGGGSPGRRSSRPAPPDLQEFRISIQEDGSLLIRNPEGHAVTGTLEQRVRRERRAEILSWMSQMVDLQNQRSEEIVQIHLLTPAPLPSAAFHPTPFDTPPPETPTLPEPSLLDRALSRRRTRLEEQREAALRAYDRAMEEWTLAERAHRELEAAREQEFHRAQSGEKEALLGLLEGHLGSLKWPLETEVSLEFTPDGTVWLDVDLPEIEDLPAEETRRVERGLRLPRTPKSASQLRGEYLRHILGVAFRLVGETFHLLPGVSQGVVSGYSQRLDPATGRLRDDYLYSVRVDPALWLELDFNQLAAIDPEWALGRFDLRISKARGDVLHPIPPFSPHAS